MKKVAIIFLTLYLCLHAEQVTDVNHPPFSLNSGLVIGSYVGNQFVRNLTGKDPDGDDFYFLLDNATFLSSEGIDCNIYHSNQLSCAISPNLTIDPNGTCQLKPDYQIKNCEETTIEYHLVDSKGMSSLKHNSIRLLITANESNETNNIASDITKNPRGFLNEIVQKSQLTSYGAAAFGNNIGVNMINSDIFTDNNSTLKGQAESANNIIQNGDISNIATDKLMRNTRAMNAMGDAYEGVSKEQIDSTISQAVNSISYESTGAPIECTIERRNVSVQTYYVCSEDPMLSVNPALATKYYATTGSEQNALKTCESACQTTSTCDPKNISDTYDFVRNMNFLNEDAKNTALNNIKNKLSSFSRINVYKMNSSGTITDSFTTTLATPVNTVGLSWDDSIIPSSKTIDNNLVFKTSFMGDDKYTSTTSGNTYILKPMISYWAIVGSKNVLDSYDGSTLYTIIFSNDVTKYACPLPNKNTVLYSSNDTCNAECKLQHDCVLMTDGSYDPNTVDEIQNNCKDVTVPLGGGGYETLQSAVENGDCSLKDEYTINSNNEIGHYYVRDGVIQDAFRPDIGFSDGPDVLKKEKATEVAYAFENMITSAKDMGQIDHTNKLNSLSFKDFNFQDSDKMFEVLPMVEGPMSSFRTTLGIKINPTYFDFTKAPLKRLDSMSSDEDRNLYNAYTWILGKVPSINGFNWWKNHINPTHLSNPDLLNQEIYDAALQYVDNHSEHLGVGIAIGLLEIDEPFAVDENTTYHTKFKILDRFGNFRTAFVTGSNVAFRTGNREIPDFSDPVVLMIYKEYLRTLGREPDIGGFLTWERAIKDNNWDAATFHQRLVEAAQNNHETFYNPPVINDSPPILNDMLNNYKFAHGGTFDKATASFVAPSNHIYDPSKYMIVNPYVYNLDLRDNFMTLYAFDSLNPIRTIRFNPLDFTGGGKSSFKHSYYYLFAYIDYMKNMSHMSIRDFMDRVWEDYKSGNKKYFVWDYKSRKKAVKLLDRWTTTDWKDNEYINRFGRLFDAESFYAIPENKNIATTFYNDITQNKDDYVYIQKAVDNYNIKVNGRANGDSPCINGYAVGAVDGNTSQCQRRVTTANNCPSGTTYDPASNLCVGNNPACINGTYNAADNTCTNTTDVPIFSQDSSDIAALYFIPKKTSCQISVAYDMNSGTANGFDSSTILRNGNRISVTPTIVADTGTTYTVSGYKWCWEMTNRQGCGNNLNNQKNQVLAWDGTNFVYYFTMYSDYHYSRLYKVTLQPGDIYEADKQWFGRNYMKSKIDLIRGVQEGPSCTNDSAFTDDGKFENITVTKNQQTEAVCPSNAPYLDDQGHCYANPICRESTFGNVDNTKDKCYMPTIPPVYSYNKNGYYFLYLKKDNDNNFKFLTPLISQTPYLCKKDAFTCPDSNTVYNSQQSCEKYCDSACVDNNAETTLVSKQFFNMENCTNSCNKVENISPSSIKMKLVVKNDIATQSGDISIIKYTNSGNTDYSNQIVHSNGNIYLSEDNSGIDLGNVKNGDEIDIQYTSRNGIIGLGRANDSYLSSLPMGYIQNNSQYGECANMHAYYPNMGIYLQLDYDKDGVPDTNIKLSETFICHPSGLSTILQKIKLVGNQVQYDYIDEFGNKTTLTKDIYIKDYGVCKNNHNTNDAVDVSLSQIYLSSDYVPSATKLTLNDFNTTLRFAYRPDMYSIGTIDRDLSRLVEYANNSRDPLALYTEINTNHIIPIPLFRGVYGSDAMDMALVNTGLDPHLNSSIGDYKLYAGFGFVPWNDCRNFNGLKTQTRNIYITKTDCSQYDSSYHYSSNIRKCVGSRYIDTNGNYYCAYGTDVNGECVVDAGCPDGWTADPADANRCYKSTITTTEGTVQVCKPWWKIMRSYTCNNISSVGNNLLNNIVAGPPRFVNTCKEYIRNYKSLAIDSNGNIIEQQ